jgi:hypothetical protein
LADVGLLDVALEVEEDFFLSVAVLVFSFFFSLLDFDELLLSSKCELSPS